MAEAWHHDSELGNCTKVCIDGIQSANQNFSQAVCIWILYGNTLHETLHEERTKEGSIRKEFTKQTRNKMGRQRLIMLTPNAETLAMRRAMLRKRSPVILSRAVRLTPVSSLAITVDQSPAADIVDQLEAAPKNSICN